MDMPQWLKEAQDRIIRQGPRAVQKYNEMVECGQEGEKALHTGRYKNALACFQKQQELCRELDFPDHEPLGRIGDVYFREGKNREALEYFHNALALAEKLPDPLGQLNNLGRIGDAYLLERRKS